MTKQFLLPESDMDFLNSLGLPWETRREGNISWLIIIGYPVPKGYNLEKVNVALMIDPGYPVSQIDMVYFHPHLERIDKKAIGALAIQPINGIAWQRWSRHRTGPNPWRPGIDDISTHLLLVDHWMERELKTQ